ncbi:guanylate-binding protein 6-like [Leptodactylus fuscus]|uniref:guanylate-binding protein 6-like n=1 Tax=Leptodactylus fuscus TaxID=238119 RepID=UPI003F4EE0CF
MEMDLPVCLIENTADGKLRVNAEATEILSKISQPVVVVAIVGLYRTGKSYLMNKLARCQKCFDLGSTVQAKTKGIWMQCLPHPTREGHTLVLLDTEGLGDVEKGDKMHDMWIFCLAVLLSSALVYNSKAVINEDAIEKLHYVSEMAEFIKVRSKDNDNDEAEFSRYFPIFIWAVRDVTLKLVFNGKPITEDEYLEKALMIQKGESSRKVDQRNMTRDCIRMYFKTRKCFMFDLPTGDKEVLQNMDETSEDQLSKAFMAQTKKFCDYIYNNAEVKCVGDMHKVTGETLAKLATFYTEAISSSNATCMEDMVANISVAENTAAVKEATEYYEKKMKEQVKLPTETLDQILELSAECEKEASKIFLKRSFKDTELHFHKQFLEIKEQKKSEFLKRNDMESRRYCEKLIKELSKDLENSLTKGSYVTLGGYQIFKEEMERIEEKYNNEPRKGTKAGDVLQDFKKSKEMISITIMMNDKALSDQQKKIEEDKVSKEAKELQLKIEESQRSEENKKMEHQRKIMEENFRELVEKGNNENRLLMEQLKSIRGTKEKERDLYRSQGDEEHAMMYQEQINDLSRKEKEAKSFNWLPLVEAGFMAIASCFLPPSVVLAGAIFSGVRQLFRK